jgi:hypothetical protein
MKRNASAVAMVLVASVLSMGNYSCDSRPATLTCDAQVPIELVPGMCIHVDNPCEDRQWHSFSDGIDGFSLPHAPEGIYVSTTWSSTAAERQVCALSMAPSLRDEPVPYVYGRGNDIGRGELRVTVGIGLTASQTQVSGTRWRITAHAAPGSGPYTFGIDDLADASGSSVISRDGNTFLVEPSTIRTYRVHVADGFYHHSSAEISLGPGMALAMEQSAASIVRGESATVAVRASGGMPPYQFEWAAAPGLVLTSGANVIVAPLVTTSYRVTVTDASGAIAEGTATIEVTAPPPPAADGPVAQFSYTHCCFEVLRLDASASSGDIVSYAWDFSWVPMNPEIVTPGATAQYFAFPTTVGTITLTVTDRAGRTATVTRQFTP